VSTTIEELRVEHGREVIGPKVRELLSRVVAATAPIYPASEYSDARIWNAEAFEDALHDWIAMRLLGRGDLAAMLASAGSVGSLRRALTTSFAQFLMNRRRRTSASNLYSRMQKALRTDSRFERVGKSSLAHEQLWTLRASPTSEPARKGLGELTAIASTLSDDELGVVRYGPHSLKSSPILRDPEIPVFLTTLLSGAEGALRMSTISEVAKRRFNLTELEPAELEDVLESDEPTPQQALERNEVVRSILAQLGKPRVDLIRSLTQRRDLDEAAQALGISHAHAGELLSQAMRTIAEYASDLEEARTLYEEVSATIVGESRF
jgi:hypothetical protein